MYTKRIDVYTTSEVLPRMPSSNRPPNRAGQTVRMIDGQRCRIPVTFFNRARVGYNFMKLIHHENSMHINIF